MTDAWAPERVVDEALARELLASDFPYLAGASIEPLGAGFDNTAYLVDGEWVFRFPRREIAVPLLEAETRILPAIAPCLPLAVPLPELVGRPTAAYPWPFVGYRRIAGETACTAALDDRARLAAAPLLGAFVRALHDLTEDEIAALDRGGLSAPLRPPLAPPGDTMRRADVAYRKVRAIETLGRLRAHGLVDAEQTRVYERVVADARDTPTAPQTLVHGDLYVRHVLVGDDALPTGVIDWGDVHVGHPGVDLALGYSFFGPDARASFFEARGGVDDELAAFARFRATYHTASVLEYAHATGDADLEREARRGLGWALEGQP